MRFTHLRSTADPQFDRTRKGSYRTNIGGVSVVIHQDQET